MKLTRTDQDRLVKQIQDSAASVEIVAVTRLLRAMYEDAKDSLVRVAPEEFARAQGAALALDKVLRLLTRQTITAQIRE